MDWISKAAFALDSAPLWISAIDIHIRTKKFDVAAKLLRVVQRFPIRDLRSVLALANNSDLLQAFPQLRISSVLSSTQLSRIKLYETYTETLNNVQNLKSAQELKKAFERCQSTINIFQKDFESVPYEQKQLQLEFGIDPILFLYHDAFLKFSMFANHMEYAMIFCRLFVDHLTQPLESQQVTETIRGGFVSRLQETLLRLKEFSCFPNPTEIELQIATLSVRILQILENQSINKNWLVINLIELLQGFKAIHTSQIIVSLVNRLVALARPEAIGNPESYRQFFTSITNSCDRVLCSSVPGDIRNNLLVRTRTIWRAWIQMEKILSQYQQVMKGYEAILSYPDVC